MGDDINVGSADHLFHFGEISAVDFVGGMGAEIILVEHEIAADKMHRANDVIEWSRAAALRQSPADTDVVQQSRSRHG